MEAVLLEKNNGVATITMNMPEKMNSLVPEMCEGLYEATQKAKTDDEVKVVILTGTKNAFCAGGDISQFEKGIGLLEGIDEFAPRHQWVTEFYNLKKPTIAAVNGFAVGAGFGLALMCDVIFAAESAKFGLSFVNVGVAPDYAIAYILPRIIGIHKVKELFFTGRNLSAQQAYDMDVINEVIPDDAFASHVEKYAEKLAKGPSVSFALGKTMLNRSLDSDLNGLLTLEAYTQSMLFQTDDSKEAAIAFMNKRKPVFKGR